MSYETVQTIAMIIVCLTFLRYVVVCIMCLFKGEIDDMIQLAFQGLFVVGGFLMVLFGLVDVIYPKEAKESRQKIEQMNSGYDDNYYEDDRDAFDPGW